MPTLDTTDYYSLCELGVMTLFRTLSYFSPNPMRQVSDNRYNINKGADYWAVFVPSTFTSTKLDPHNYRYVWVIVFDLYVRYKTAEEALSKFREVRATIDNLLGVYPTLNGVRGVESLQLSARSELLQDTPGDNPNFMIQTMAVSVAQRVTRQF